MENNNIAELFWSSESVQFSLYCSASKMILKNCLKCCKWNKTWSPLHAMHPFLDHCVVFFYVWCCRLCAVKSWYICKNIYSPPRLKTLPCQWAAISCPIQMDRSRYTTWAFPLLFFLVSQAFSFRVEMMQSMSTLPQALNSFHTTELLCFAVKTPIVSLIGREKIFMIVSEENIM